MPSFTPSLPAFSLPDHYFQRLTPIFVSRKRAASRHERRAMMFCCRRCVICDCTRLFAPAIRRRHAGVLDYCRLMSCWRRRLPCRFTPIFRGAAARMRRLCCFAAAQDNILCAVTALRRRRAAAAAYATLSAMMLLFAAAVTRFRSDVFRLLLSIWLTSQILMFDGCHCFLPCRAYAAPRLGAPRRHA